MKKVLITSSEFAKTHWAEVNQILNEAGCEAVLNRSGKAMSAAEICAVAAQHKIEGILVYSSSDDINGLVFEKCFDLKVVSRHGVGVDNIDLKTAEARGVLVKKTDNTGDYQAVADLTFGLMLASARRITEVDRSLRSGKWVRPVGSGVWGKTLGIVGLGRIGKAVAKRGKGFNMKVLVSDPFIDFSYIEQEGLRLCPLESLLRESDFITLHTGLTEETKNLIGKDELAIMKRTAYLINTARAGLVDQDALLTALRTDKIAGAAIDVYRQEPATDDILLNTGLDNLVATSHIGSYTTEVLRQMDIQAVTNITEVLTIPGKLNN